MKRFFKYFFLGLLLFLIIGAITSYQPGQAVEHLIEKHGLGDSQFMEIDGMNVHYRISGKGHPLVLIHGVASSLHTWLDWQDILDDHFRVISFDVPSFGLTGPHPEDDYSVDMYMNFLDKLTTELNIDSCYLAGNSFGGFLSWNYAAHNPEKVKKIILVDAAGIPKEERRSSNIGFLLTAHPLTKGITHTFTPRSLVYKTLENVYGDPSRIDDDIYELYYDMLTREGNREAFSKVLNTERDKEEGLQKIKSISQPTLIQWGDKDVLIPVEDAHKFDELILDSEVKIYDGVGHVPMEEIPKQSAADALEFLIEK